MNFRQPSEVKTRDTRSVRMVAQRKSILALRSDEGCFSRREAFFQCEVGCGMQFWKFLFRAIFHLSSANPQLQNSWQLNGESRGISVFLAPTKPLCQRSSLQQLAWHGVGPAYYLNEGFHACLFDSILIQLEWLGTEAKWSGRDFTISIGMWWCEKKVTGKVLRPSIYSVSIHSTTRSRTVTGYCFAYLGTRRNGAKKRSIISFQLILSCSLPNKGEGRWDNCLITSVEVHYSFKNSHSRLR